MKYPLPKNPFVERLRDILAWIHDLFGRCHFCHWRRAVWSYMPGRDSACDECVPRGCSCTMEPIDGDYDNIKPGSWEHQTDEKGRKIPCCEWWRDDE